jgi:acyl-coenzyme A thioesterase PaaI-like protein
VSDPGGDTGVVTPDPPGFMADLGLDHWIEGDRSHGRAPVTPGLWVPHTEFVRIGVLVQLADAISGQPPSGPITPTTDISLHVTGLRPMASVHLVSRVLKAGRLLAVCETLLMADDEDEPFAYSLSTFMNRSVPILERGARPPQPPLDQPLAERIGARVHARGVVELAPRSGVANPHHDTILGGVVAMLAELAAESLLAGDGPVVVTDLDVRFLNRVKVGPARATARPLMVGPAGQDVVVEIEDVGNEGRPVAFATARVRSLP